MSLVKLVGGTASIRPDSDVVEAPSDSYRVEQAATGEGKFLNVIEVSAGAAPPLSAQAVTSSATVHGAVFDDQVVLFSSRARGAAATLPFSYTIQGTEPRTHTLVNLEGAVSVEIDRDGSTTTITVSTGSQHPPNDAGMIRFADGA